MKDKILKVFILFLIFAFSISLFFFLNKPLKCKVLKVVEADEFILDFNGNNRIDDNETVKLKRVTAFKMTKNNLDIEFKFIDSKELFKIGYLAKSWAKDYLFEEVCKNF